MPPPPRFIEHDLSIPVATEEGRLFRVLCDHMEHATENRAMSALIKLEMWMRIQQFLVHPQIYIDAMRESLLRKGGVYPRPDWPQDGGCSKWTACMRELADAVAARVGTIVFCNFRAEMDLVEFAAREVLGAEVFSIRGAANKDVVPAARAAVQAGKPVVVIVQIVSGGAGLNLQFCRRILFLSQHWNPAVVHQAVGRAVRIGQSEVVDIHVFRVVDDVVDNIDRRMEQIHIAKIAAARSICPSFFPSFGTPPSSR